MTGKGDGCAERLEATVEEKDAPIGKAKKEEHKQCHYIVPKKNRRCKMLTRAGRRFCGEHAVFEPGDDSRIHCPLDPRHTVLKAELEVHLASRCNSRYQEGEAMTMNVNAIERETGFRDKIDYRPSEEEIAVVADILLRHEEQLMGEIEAGVGTGGETSTGEEEWIGPIERYLALPENAELSHDKRKHLRQINNIITNMSHVGLLRDEATTAVCDLGAGKAQLTYWAAQCAPRSRYIIVDRMGSRNKWDNRALKERPELSMHRLRVSIEHLDLRRVPEIGGISGVVGLCKHLCGSGTDAGVRCMLRLDEKTGDTVAAEGSLALDGLVLAPCCAHKARFAEYTGHPFLAGLGIETPALFAALRHAATWATAGIPPKDGEEDGAVNSASWKTRVGRIAKAAMEIGRAKEIERAGYRVKVVRYVGEDTSPENLLIIAERRRIEK